MSSDAFVLNKWKNILVEYDDHVLIEKSKTCNPRLIKFLKRNELKNDFVNRDTASGYKILFGENLKKIDEFSNFTIDTFYKKFSQFNSKEYLNLFEVEQKAFFNLKNKYVFNYLNETLVGCLVVGLIEDHPYFKESVWHVGYWGIDKSKVDKTISEKIKFDWCQLLGNLNSESPIVAVIDFTNLSSDNLSKKMNFKIVGVRLDELV